jgi:hypothetical protein
MIPIISRRGAPRAGDIGDRLSGARNSRLRSHRGPARRRTGWRDAASHHTRHHDGSAETSGSARCRSGGRVVRRPPTEATYQPCRSACSANKAWAGFSESPGGMLRIERQGQCVLTPAGALSISCRHSDFAREPVIRQTTWLVSAARRSVDPLNRTNAGSSGTFLPRLCRPPRLGRSVQRVPMNKCGCLTSACGTRTRPHVVLAPVSGTSLHSCARCREERLAGDRRLPARP